MARGRKILGRQVREGGEDAGPHSALPRDLRAGVAVRRIT